MKKEITASTKITFRLTAFWQKDGPKMGKRLNEAELGDFQDIESAARFLKKENPSRTWPYLFYYELTPSPDFKGCDAWPVTIFDRNGVLRGSYDDYKTGCFPGREAVECRYQPGDIVQFGSYRLYLGVVLNQPPDMAFVARVGGETGLTRCSSFSWEHGHPVRFGRLHARIVSGICHLPSQNKQQLFEKTRLFSFPLSQKLIRA